MSALNSEVQVPSVLLRQPRKQDVSQPVVPVPQPMVAMRAAGVAEAFPQRKASHRSP